MRKMWRQFKSFALNGSMLDLALGFIIGTAFAGIITALSDEVMSPLIATIFGKEGFSGLHASIHNGPRIYYGEFLTALVNFFFFALILFLFLKFIAAVGAGRVRDFEEKQCPYCMEYIQPQALVCKVCCQPLVAQLPDVASADARAAKLRERKHLKLPIDLKDFDIPGIDLADLTPGRLRRRPAAKAAPKSTTTVTTTTAVVTDPETVVVVTGTTETDTDGERHEHPQD